MSLVIARSKRLDLESFSRAANIHPDLARRLVALGLIDARDTSGELWFSPTQLAVVARIQRLRAGFSMNYAARMEVTEAFTCDSATSASWSGPTGPVPLACCAPTAESNTTCATLLDSIARTIARVRFAPSARASADSYCAGRRR